MRLPARDRRRGHRGHRQYPPALMPPMVPVPRDRNPAATAACLACRTMRSLDKLKAGTVVLRRQSAVHGIHRPRLVFGPEDDRQNPRN